jgi:hypothetical protein
MIVNNRENFTFTLRYLISGSGSLPGQSWACLTVAQNSYLLVLTLPDRLKTSCQSLIMIKLQGYKPIHKRYNYDNIYFLS